ncbi:Tnfaip3p [Branchiostoma belcheri]|nr:Tnfaip3p [Branchiostoma belcheri]
MCVRIYLNGDGMGKGSHISLFFVLMKGHFDRLLRWPFHLQPLLLSQDPDRPLILRKQLDHAMQRDGGVLRQRWACKRRASDADVGGVSYEPGQWDREWMKMVKMASATPNAEAANLTRYAPLEEFHIFVMAHILYRPIIVLADVTFRDLSPNPFGGIYLPLLRHPEQCVRSPIVLVYDDQHFMPLFTTEGTSANSPTVHTIPLVRFRRNRMNLPVQDILPIPYVLPQEQSRDLLSEYLNIVHLQENGNDMLPASELEVVPLPDDLNLFTDFVNFDWEASLDQIPQPRGFSAIDASQKPFGIVRPTAQAAAVGRRSPSESLPIACTEGEDGAGTSGSPRERSYLRQKLLQGEHTATVVSPTQQTVPSSTRSPPPFPDQENAATALHGETVGLVQQTRAMQIQPTDVIAIQPRTQTAPSSGEEHPPANGDVSSRSAPSSQTYAAAVKSRPGPPKQPRIPKPFCTPTYKPTCKTEGCGGSPSRQNGGFCMKCQRQNSAEEREKKRRSASSLQGSMTRPDTPVKFGRGGNKKRSEQPRKPQKRQTTPTSTPSQSLVHQKGRQQQTRRASAGGHPSIQDQRNITGTNVPASLTGTNATDVSSQVQLPGPAQHPNLDGICKTEGCRGLGLPEAGGFCLECWSARQDPATINMQQRQAASRRGQGSPNVPRNISNEPKRKTVPAAGWNEGVNPGVTPQQPCTAPGCQGVVDETVHATLCPECFSLLERRNSSQMGNGRVADNLRIPNPSLSASSPAQPDDRFYTQQPDVRKCFTKGCRRTGLRENGYYCSVHTSRGTPQRGQQQVGHQSSADNTSQQFNNGQHNGAAAPVSEYGPVCPKCGRPGIAWFDDLCQKCHKQQQQPH